MNPRVSIIIPAYNTDNYIKQAIESALGQTESRIEVIVVDDASTDKTVEVVRTFTDQRLKLLVNESNKGPSYSRNRALKEAKGEWVALLDSDDWYAPNRLEKLLQVAYQKNADLIADDMHLIADDTDSSHNTYFSGKKINFKTPINIDTTYFIDFSLGITKPLIKREFLICHALEFNEELKYGEDLFLFLLCLVNGACFTIVPEPYYFYRSRTGSLMTEQTQFYEQAYNTNLYLLQQEFTKKDPKIAASLYRRLSEMKLLRAFYKVKPYIKKKDFLNAWIVAMQNPIFFWALCVRIPIILNYHLSRRLSLLTQIFTNQKTQH
ncbi:MULTISPECIES: glycosyltransferase family 2 protein [unclassified Tolypothrix]|uniref:glycosyltransferase family 2 protein n=1 Tax=unclassified Tolypothrix TaxID=2649714 RepID=UPI0005EAA82B|nr:MULTISPECIES: glycosyltransferase family 2 protein [unclassified Tolypothrix]BAY91940.1 glycosyl transferase family protein [Microchaete diplosiphon NIES-3275]EKF04883.1 glycosyltransferase, group 2 family protein [Tolypothrix sp. PCC 7601]MBE9082720.1 glycosyltransferase family 2 protein [Tolypothrix sp. LEGE 11397]UYD25939.1 glycosyltransferase family 2 protein [Tolypothrix sp. PCC 7712]UYD31822.1 glycosyltransferase family 2 protein [Tolypothrix sp. PCC 7601]